jgi:hypothetical protein
MHEFKTTGRDGISDSRPDHVQPSLSKAENLSRLLSVLDDVLNEQDANEMMGEVAFKQAQELRHSLQTKKRLERDLPVVLPSFPQVRCIRKSEFGKLNIGFATYTMDIIFDTL